MAWVFAGSCWMELWPSHERSIWWGVTVVCKSLRRGRTINVHASSANFIPFLSSVWHCCWISCYVSLSPFSEALFVVFVLQQLETYCYYDIHVLCSWGIMLVLVWTITVTRTLYRYNTVNTVSQHTLIAASINGCDCTTLLTNQGVVTSWKFVCRYMQTHIHTHTYTQTCLLTCHQVSFQSIAWTLWFKWTTG